MIVVSDTSPLIALSRIGQLDLLRALYGEVYIPATVAEEAFAQAHAPGAPEIAARKWIVVRVPTHTDLLPALAGELDAGEAAAIALAVEIDTKLLLMDERRGRRAASRLGLSVVGVLGILLEAKQQGMIPRLRPLLDALRTSESFYMTDALYEHVLQEAGEQAE